MMLLVRDGQDPESFRPRFAGCGDRLRVMVSVTALDRRLARGEAPESSGPLALRARTITSVATRRALARNWEHLVGAAQGGEGTPVPLQARRIAAAGPDIAQMLETLVAELPTPARGVAMARLLLADGAGPLYNRDSPVDLCTAVRETTAQLDPFIPLAASAVRPDDRRERDAAGVDEQRGGQPGRLRGPGPS